MRGRGNATGERELQPMSGTLETASARRRQGIIQNPLVAPPQPPYHYPPPGTSTSQLTQTTLNPFSNQFSMPQRIRDRRLRFPVLTSAILPEFAFLFHIPTPTPAHVPHPAGPVAQHNTQPPIDDFPSLPFNDMSYFPSPV